MHNLLLAGCTHEQTGAVIGQSNQTIEHYAKHIDQRRLAEAAIRRLVESG